MGLLRSGLVKRSQIMPAMAMPTHSQGSIDGSKAGQSHKDRDQPGHHAEMSMSKWDSPVEIWMKPKTMMMSRATSLEAVNRSCTLVAALTLMQFTNVANTSDTTYCDDGRMMSISTHSFRKAASSPYTSRMAPMVEITPQADQTIRESPAEPVSLTTPVGVTKMPEPMMVPMIIPTPLKRVMLRLSTIFSPLAGRSVGLVAVGAGTMRTSIHLTLILSPSFPPSVSQGYGGEELNLCDDAVELLLPEPTPTPNE
ncbi:hypothetical protein EYF80_002083 [Liparis tanakae]|uniref:Uncharacterized protein n=1 Tax=Liparis tanakae TaxID=230148 RepID=A0A4Z2JC09_9TELE|nr:hypothetical protein EYF80_002083 [Liparis tanakae]